MAEVSKGVLNKMASQQKMAQTFEAFGYTLYHKVDALATIYKRIYTEFRSIDARYRIQLLLVLHKLLLYKVVPVQFI